MELPLLVVESVQNALQVRDLRQIRHEIVQQGLVVDLTPVWNLGIDAFGVFEKTALLDLLVLEEQVEQFKVLHLEEGVERLGGVGELFLCEIDEQTMIKEDLSLEMLGQLLVVGLQEQHHIFQFFSVLAVLEDLLDEEVEDIV